MKGKEALAAARRRERDAQLHADELTAELKEAKDEVIDLNRRLRYLTMVEDHNQELTRQIEAVTSPELERVKAELADLKVEYQDCHEKLGEVVFAYIDRVTGLTGLTRYEGLEDLLRQVKWGSWLTENDYQGRLRVEALGILQRKSGLRSRDLPELLEDTQKPRSKRKEHAK